MVAAGRGAQNVIFRAVRLDGERDGPALDDLFVKKLQGGPWFQSDFFQDGFGLAFQFRVNPAFADGAGGLRLHCAHQNVRVGVLPKSPGRRPN
jgi:hypothetical protein